MKKITIGQYSDGKEEFIVQRIFKGIAYLFTRTGVKFLRAKRNSTVDIGEKSLNNFFNNELKGFSKIDKTN